MDVIENVKHISWNDLDKSKYYSIGSLFMISENLVLFPSVLIKTRLQVQQAKSLYNGTWDAAKKIYRYEGIRGLYKGYAFSNLFIVGSHIYLTSFEFTRAKLPTNNESLKSLIAGLVAVLVSEIVIVPVDIISQKQMVFGQDIVSNITTKSNCKSRTAWSVILDISKTSGIKGFFKGYVPSIWCYGPGSALYWGAYYELNQRLGSIRPTGTPNLVVQAISGPAAAAISCSITNPVDVIKVRVQVDGGTVSNVFWTLYKSEGFAGFYKGFTAKLAYTIPSGLIVIMSYEIIKILSLKNK